MHTEAADPDRLDCRLFVDSAASERELADRLVEGEPRAKVEHAGPLLVASFPSCRIEVLVNELWRPGSRKWMEFRYSLEVYRTTAGDPAGHVRLVGRVLEKLWAGGCSATAACDYEDALPHEGARALPS